jgi:hypothetical protein
MDNFSALADFALRYHVHIVSGTHTTHCSKGTPYAKRAKHEADHMFLVRRLRLDGGIEYFHQIVNFSGY